ncbi:MAG: anion permease [Oscillospiraceae bacterium]|nr:anion permease [Oscillospiraceae bacterium]
MKLTARVKPSQTKTLGLVLAVIVIAAFALIPPFAGLAEYAEDPEAAMASIGIFIGAIILFVSQVTPLAVSCLTLMVLLPYFGISSLTEIWSDFGGSSFFFVFFCFGVTGALTNTTIPLRISAWLTKISRGNAKVLVFGFTYVITLLSGFLSNFGTLIMFFGIIMMFLQTARCLPGESNLGKCLMIALPFAAGNGGLLTPAGSPGNLIAQSLLANVGYDISFGGWFLMCWPWPFVMSTLVALSLCIIFKPENLSQEGQQSVFDARAEISGFTRQEITAMAIIIATIALWFLSTWISSLNTTVIAACAFFLMFLPVVGLMDWKTYVKEADWNLLMMVGSVAITMGCVNSTGAMSWIMNSLFANVGLLNSFLLFLVVGFVICYLRVLIPTNPSVAAIFVPVMIGIAEVVAQTSGVDYTLAMSFVPLFWGGATITLLYTEPIYLYTYSSGYFSAGDLFKAGLGPTLVMIVIIAAVFPIWFGMFA